VKLKGMFASMELLVWFVRFWVVVLVEVEEVLVAHEAAHEVVHVAVEEALVVSLDVHAHVRVHGSVLFHEGWRHDHHKGKDDDRDTVEGMVVE